MDARGGVRCPAGKGECCPLQYEIITSSFKLICLILFHLNNQLQVNKMVLAQPANQHVSKAFDLSGKVAIVTGGARGIGLEVSRGLAEAGANVCCVGT
jgi:hypothetical protein